MIFDDGIDPPAIWAQFPIIGAVAQLLKSPLRYLHAKPIERRCKLLANKIRKLSNFDKDEMISAEKEKLQNCFKEIPENKKKVCSGLIENAAFMTATLKELQGYSDKYGVIERTADGSGTKESPSVKSYNTMINRYCAVVKQLVDMLPAEQEKPRQDELLEFIKNK